MTGEDCAWERREGTPGDGAGAGDSGGSVAGTGLRRVDGTLETRWPVELGIVGGVNAAAESCGEPVYLVVRKAAVASVEAEVPCVDKPGWCPPTNGLVKLASVVTVAAIGTCQTSKRTDARLNTHRRLGALAEHGLTCA